MLGQIAERYQLLEKVGKGGMGSVYRAKDRLRDSIIAVKRMSVSKEQVHNFASQSQANISDTQDFHLAMALEFKTLASLHHPNIINVLDYGFDEEHQPFFTMPLLVDALSITDYAIEASPEQKIAVIMQVLHAVQYLHRRGVIHRDIKPDNVLVTPDGQVKVMDLGLALTTTDSTSEANLGTVGTIAYMAPELFAEEAATVASDLYAVGLLIYQIYKGELPFNTRNVMLLINGILHQTPDTAGIEPALAALLDKALAKKPTERFQSAEDFIQVFSKALQIPLEQDEEILESYLKSANFVGRKTQLRQLLAALEEAQTGKGSLYLVAGDAGIGKSRLLDELRIRALIRGTQVLEAQEVQQAKLNYKLWRDILPYLLLSTPIDDKEAGILKAIVPNITKLVGRTIPTAPILSGQSGKRRLMRTISDLLARQTKPTLLLLEDLHWTRESLDVLRSLQKDIQQQRLLIVGSYRPEEYPNLPSELPQAQVIRLGRMSNEEIRQLCETMLGEAGKRADVIELIQHEADGNALFMVEVVRTLAEEAGHLDKIGLITLPESILDGGIERSVQNRIKRVPNDYRQLLQVAALAGRYLDLAVLQLLHTAKKPTLDQWLNLCANVGIIESLDGRWRFTHEKLREAIVNMIEESDKSPIHARIAQAIESIHAQEIDDYAEILYFHWERANEIEEALDYLVQVADRYVYFSARYEQARTLLNHGLGLLEKQHTFRHEIEIQYLLGQVYDFMGQYHIALNYYELSLGRAIFADDERGMIQALNGLSGLHRRTGNIDVSESFARDSVELARKLGEPLSLAESLNTHGWVLGYQAHYDEAQAVLEESERLYRAENSLHGLSFAIQSLGNIRRFTREYPLAQTYYEQALDIARDIGDREGGAMVQNYLGDVQRQQGHYAIANDYYQQAISTLDEIGAVAMKGMALARAIHGVLLVHDLSTAKAYFLEVLETAQDLNATTLDLYILTGGMRYAYHMGLTQQAVEWASLVWNHPNCYQYHRLEVENLLPELKNSLEESDFQTAWERGKKINIYVALGEIRKLLK